MKLKIKIHPTQRLAYIPQQIYQILGNDVIAVPSVFAVVCYPSNAPLEKVRKSLQLILADLALMEEKTTSNEAKTTFVLQKKGG